MRIGLVGCGRIAFLAHLPHLSDSPRWTLVSVADPSPARLEYARRKFGVDLGFHDGRSLIEYGNIDAVVIATHDLEHADLVAAALAANLHVFVEKPFTADPVTGQRLLREAGHRRRVLMVGYQKLFDPCLLGVKDLIRNGLAPSFARLHNHSHDNMLIQAATLPVFCTSAQFSAGTTDYGDGLIWHELLSAHGFDVQPDLAEAYRLVLNLACHEHAVLLYLFGPPEYVDHVDIWPRQLSCLTVLRWANGMRAVVETAQASRPWYDEELSLFDPHLTVNVRWPSPFKLGEESVLEVLSTGHGGSYARKVSTSGPGSRFRDEMEAFRTAIQNGVDEHSTAEVAQGVTDLVYRIFARHQGLEGDAE